MARSRRKCCVRQLKIPRTDEVTERREFITLLDGGRRMAASGTRAAAGGRCLGHPPAQGTLRLFDFQVAYQPKLHSSETFTASWRR